MELKLQLEYLKIQCSSYIFSEFTVHNLHSQVRAIFLDCERCTSRGLLGILLITTVLTDHDYLLLQQIDRVKSSPILPNCGDDCIARERFLKVRESYKMALQKYKFSGV